MAVLRRQRCFALQKADALYGRRINQHRPESVLNKSIQTKSLYLPVVFRHYGFRLPAHRARSASASVMYTIASVTGMMRGKRQMS